MTRRRIFHAVLALTTISIAASPLSADDPDNCLLCHQFRGLGRIDNETQKIHAFYVDPDYSHLRQGPHARLACTDCHERTEVVVVPHQPVSRVDCARQCHLSNPNGIDRRFSHDPIESMLASSSHTLETLGGLDFDGGPLLDKDQSSCLYCHDEPYFRLPLDVAPQLADATERGIDRCNVCHAETVPIDVEYDLNHMLARLQPSRSPLEIAQTCAVCHSDSKVTVEHKMSDAVASYVRSFHGKATLLGEHHTADCLSCHVRAGENAHLMLGKDNPLSSVHAQNVANSCRSTQCHPGADPAFATAAVHLDIPTAHGTIEYALAAIFIFLTIFTFGPSALLVILDLLQIIVGRVHHPSARIEKLTHEMMANSEGRKRLKRFSPGQRVQHWCLTILFVTLVLTGFPMKFADRAWASFLVDLFGGLSIARNVHHWSGILLFLGFSFHVVQVVISSLRTAKRAGPDGRPLGLVKAWLAMPMWISPQDIRKTMQLFAHLLFLRKERPTFGRFSPAEKFEYLGVFWGTMLLGLTGALLWGEQYASRFLAGKTFNLATIAHTFEAFLAVIHVGILHIYNVIFAPKVFPLSPATITGNTPVEKLVEEHSEFVEDAAMELGFSVKADPTA
ncbi:MAG TPA: cytochrome b/b6 domain-containing protein [Phycisphaerae bacterium]|nr:cytochrome b/b6 domain-containing protein [Phycisphaerae bacterium]HRW55269.1 cytochrome b/b6 domain-containing protein [Phycisphaerae bacterium]